MTLSHYVAVGGDAGIGRRNIAMIISARRTPRIFSARWQGSRDSARRLSPAEAARRLLVHGSEVPAELGVAELAE